VRVNIAVDSAAGQMTLLPQLLCFALLCHQILAERISAWPAARQAARAVVQQRARVTAKLKKPSKASSSSTTAGAKRKRSESSSSRHTTAPAAAAGAVAASKFSDYAQYMSAIERVQPHQWLALRRGAACKELTVTVTLPADSSNAAAERVVSAVQWYRIVCVDCATAVTVHCFSPYMLQSQSAVGHSEIAIVASRCVAGDLRTTAVLCVLYLVTLHCAVVQILASLPRQPSRCPVAVACMTAAAKDAWTRLLKPSLTREVLKTGYK
jgi:hypothetical protein